MIINNYTDVNERMVNTQTCNYDPQTLLATCNVKELLEAHHASTGTALVTSVNPKMQQNAEIGSYNFTLIMP
jgi:hypothetical protein